MGIITDLLQDIALPKMVKISQQFAATEVHDITEVIQTQIRRPDIIGRVKKDMRIAVAVGSRGMAEIPLIARVVVEELKRRGAKPFIVPAMGSHGGATAEGQKAVLASLGVTEVSVGCPIVSSMDVVQLGVLENGLPVLIDKNAFEADGIVVINRIKAHNAFSGPNESGLVKMITIGLGKQKGADSCHVLGFKYMAEFIVEMARIKIEQAPFLFGVGTVENAYDRIAEIAVIPAEEIIEIERALLIKAKANMPRILLNPMDVLIVDQLGKEFSGGGMDPYVTGRAPTPYIAQSGAHASRVVVLDATDNSHGNTCGMGMAEITTRRLFNKINFEFTYANILTSTVPASAMIPLIMESDRLAIQAAIKTSNVLKQDSIRMVRIANTLHMSEIYISESMLSEAEQHSDISILSQPANFVFDGKGNLF